MSRVIRFIAFVGLGGVACASECSGGSCTARSDDSAMFQLARKGAKTDPSSNESRSFVKHTRPFLGGRSGELLESEHGAIQINEDGVVNTYYLPGAKVINEGKTVKFLPPYRFYLMRTPTTDYSNADNFYKPIFPGKTFTVDMDFGSDGPSCGCNLNFYLVDMPVDFEGDEHDYYCDAQCFVGKGCCPEFDMNEGNMDVQQITNHACTGNYAGHPDWACNKWGDPEAKTHSGEFGRGPQNTIDSTKPFTFSQRFDVEGGFTFTTTMTQEGRQLVKTMGPGSGQLDSMLQSLLKGMAFVTGYWSAPDMNWMDGEACGSGPEHCNMHPAYISNWRITSSGGPVPAPPVPAPPAPAPPSPGPLPPAPTPPAPAPPTPSPPGKCCWGPECSSCKEDFNDWCDQSVENCWKCGRGAWCPRT